MKYFRTHRPQCFTREGYHVTPLPPKPNEPRIKAGDFWAGWMAFGLPAFVNEQMDE